MLLFFKESIMTPRSRKPLVITSEQRVSLPETAEKLPENSSKSSDSIYQSISPKNDSDFVSSDDELMLSKSSLHSFEHNNSNLSAVRSENTRFVINNEKRSHLVEEDLNTTLCGSENGVLIPKFKISHEVSEFSHKSKSLSEPFKEYLLSRSVLTATPIDLSLLNGSNMVEDKITESLMFCLDGNVPSDLTSSIGNLAVDKTNDSTRSPLKSLESAVNIENSRMNSPSRKRAAARHNVEIENKKLMISKENCDDTQSYELRETEL